MTTGNNARLVGGSSEVWADIKKALQAVIDDGVNAELDEMDCRLLLDLIESRDSALPASGPRLADQAVNDACWKFVETMPHRLPGPIWNDLKPAIHAALTHYHAAVLAATMSTPPSEFNFLRHLYRQREFSERTFGPGERTQGVVDHILKELLEVLAKPDDLSEWIDVVILALDGAWRIGATPEQIIEALVAKQTKNEGRQWPDWRTAEPGKAIEHVREAS